MDSTSRKEAADVARLRALRRTGGALSEFEAHEVLGAVEALRNNDRQMWDSARWALPAINRLGTLDQGRIGRFMANARRYYGNCVQDLPPDWPAGIENLED